MRSHFVVKFALFWPVNFGVDALWDDGIFFACLDLGVVGVAIEWMPPEEEETDNLI